MKHSVLIFSLLSVSSFCHAQNSLTLIIKNVRNGTGNIAISLHDTPKGFPHKAFNYQVVPAKAGEVTVVFENLTAGDYAVSTLHDTNRNGKMDTNLIGIPKEGYGFSNNVMGTFGPPSFEKAKFTLTPQPIIITMKY